jgi:Ger(x)C family germination protein
MKKKKINMIILVLVLAFIYSQKLEVPSLQDINVLAGFGFDVKRNTKGNIEKILPFSIYTIKSNVSQKEGLFSSDSPSNRRKNEIQSRIVVGKGMNLGDTRQNRQLRLNRSILPGFHKILVFSEEKARDGLHDLVDSEFENPRINDRSIVVICKGKAEDILKFNVSGYESSSDYIEGIIKNSTNYNFLGKEYNVLNTYLKIDSEGKNLVMPYIEIKDNDIILSGMAVFKGDKIAYVLPMNEARIMNIMRESNVKGVLTIQDNSKKYVNYNAVVKRKVKCKKNNDKYSFEVNLFFNGDITENTMFNEINEKNQDQIEKLIESKIEEECNGLLYKMQNTYKMDFLELGLCAAARYGRDTGIDWHEVVSNSNIVIKVNVKVDKIGKGQYES